MNINNKNWVDKYTNEKWLDDCSNLILVRDKRIYFCQRLITNAAKHVNKIFIKSK